MVASIDVLKLKVFRSENVAQIGQNAANLGVICLQKNCFEYIQQGD